MRNINGWSEGLCPDVENCVDERMLSFEEKEDPMNPLHFIVYCVEGWRECPQYRRRYEID